MNAEVSMKFTVCPVCGILYGMPEGFFESKRTLAGTSYCPTGHAWHRGYDDIRAVRAERESKERAWERNETLERSNNALRGQTKKLKKQLEEASHEED